MSIVTQNQVPPELLPLARGVERGVDVVVAAATQTPPQQEAVIMGGNKFEQGIFVLAVVAPPALADRMEALSLALIAAAVRILAAGAVEAPQNPVRTH